MGQTIELGVYEHYKGNRYRVLGVARHSETLEEFVVYEALHGDHGLWVRSISMFSEQVEVGGKKIPRFKHIEI